MVSCAQQHGDNEIVLKFSLLPPFRTEAQARHGDLIGQHQLDTLSEGGTEGIFTNLADDQALTVSAFKQCLDSYIDKFVSKYTGMLNESIGTEFQKSDEYMN